MKTEIIFNDEIITIKKKSLRPVSTLKILGYVSGGYIKTTEQVNIVLILFLVLVVAVYILSTLTATDSSFVETSFYQEHVADHHPHI